MSFVAASENDLAVVAVVADGAAAAGCRCC